MPTPQIPPQALAALLAARKGQGVTPGQRPAMPNQSQYVPQAPGVRPGMKAGGSVKGFAKGGGIESKGKTKGKVVKMACGGKAKK